MEQTKEEIISIEFEFNNEERICLYELDDISCGYSIIIENIKKDQIVVGGMLITHYLVDAIFLNLNASLDTERYYNENDKDGQSKYQLSKFKRIAQLKDIKSIMIKTENNLYTYTVPWIGEDSIGSKNPCQQSYITSDGNLYLAIAYNEDRCSWWVDEIRRKESKKDEIYKA